MPRIPQPLSSASILGGEFSTEAPAGTFGHSGLQSIARGMQDLGMGLVLNAKTRKQIEERDRKKNEDLWINQAISEYSRNVTDFEVNPENRNRTDYLPSFLEHGDQQALQFAENAPSSEAYEAFQSKAREIMDARYARSAALGADNEMKANSIAIDSAWGHQLQNYHHLAPIDPDSAAGDLIGGLANTTETIMSIYGDIAPDAAKSMVAQKIEDTVLALSEKKPAMAKDLLNNSSHYVSENRRQILLNKLEQKKQEGSLLLKEDFNTTREKILIESTRTGRAVSLPLEDYQAIYPGEQAQVMKMRDDSKIMAATDAHSFLATTTGMKPNEQMRLAADYQKSLETQDQISAFSSIVLPEIQESAAAYARDPTAWQRNNNSVIKTLRSDLELLEENESGIGSGEGVNVDGGPGVLPPKPGSEHIIKKVPSKDEVAGAKEQLHRAVLRYQGNPGEGDDASLFMGLEPQDRHLLTKDEANVLADRINRAPIDNVIRTINEIMEEYPSDDLRAQVIKDLATLPDKKVSPVHQLAFQNRNETWLPTFLANVRNVEALEKVDPVDKKQVTSAIEANGLWASYKYAIDSPENGRAEEIKGFKEAIDMHARAMVAQGMKPKEAVNTAVNQLLLSTASPVEIPRPGSETSYRNASGNTVRPAIRPSGLPGWMQPDNAEMWIPNHPEGFKNPLTPDQKVDYGRRMGTALANIHPDDVDLGQFSWAVQVKDRNKQKKLIHEKIIQTGQYYMEPGGAHFIVTVEGETTAVDAGEKQVQRVALRNKNGELFRLPLKQVPGYAQKKYQASGIKMKGLTPSTWSWDQTAAFVDYPVDDIGEDGFPKTGNFWEFVR